MLKLLHFIFSSFWVFLGTLALIYVTGISIAMAISGIFSENVRINLFSRIGDIRCQNQEN